MPAPAMAATEPWPGAKAELFDNLNFSQLSGTGGLGRGKTVKKSNPSPCCNLKEALKEYILCPAPFMEGRVKQTTSSLIPEPQMA